ncbi:2-oxo-4-hydroxy-4-carboxy-5-ureidoimidazoline decarboxylase [Actinomadura viridis]|uniref:2-oxo-4-hydroxy-4-carboxy-5-ureidoimidazoline decarboxylase n=1 Tax=Actinomadura viridis TaxID=58110 RepID=A0A931DFA4_9ACTN|nr:2-oxo-4-hydroxy-4-carboxy-5-ureidoimidazoline decarboxylase [Actinomadura viridis]MBG6087568.1 2-oxo-4-hydroxy-4-carboxy-5-ureidoimidazoline decarboxylase [Actinomadura viridis]
MHVALDGFNALAAADAEAGLLACCASRRWAAGVAAGRPYADAEALRSASDAFLAALDWADVEEALAAHPRIGERARGAGREASWSRGEQSGMDAAEAAVRESLAAGNRRYEERFGHVFLICATGLGAGDMLAALERRLGNDAAAERAVVREELGKIVRLRLDKMLRGS